MLCNGVHCWDFQHFCCPTAAGLNTARYPAGMTSYWNWENPSGYMGEAAAAHLVVAEQGVVEGVGGVGVRLHAATALDHGVRELVRVVLVEACGFV